MRTTKTRPSDGRQSHSGSSRYCRQTSTTAAVLPLPQGRISTSTSGRTVFTWKSHPNRLRLGGSVSQTVCQHSCWSDCAASDRDFIRPFNRINLGLGRLSCFVLTRLCWHTHTSIDIYRNVEEHWHAFFHLIPTTRRSSPFHLHTTGGVHFQAIRYPVVVAGCCFSQWTTSS